MKRIALLAALAIALALPAPARAATEYALTWTNYNPYYTEVIGTFPTWNECVRVQLAEGYRPGGAYGCRSI